MDPRWTGRLAGAFALIIVLVVVPVDRYLGSREYSFLLDLKEKELKGELHTAVLILKDLLGASSTPSHTIQGAAEQLGRLLGKRVTLISPDGRLLGDTHRGQERRNRQEDLSYRPEILAAKSQGYGKATRFSPDFGSETLFAVLAVADPRIPVGFIRLAYSLESLERQRTFQQRFIYLTAGIVFLIALFLSIFLDRRLRRPWQELTEMVEGLERGDYRQPFHLTTAFEAQGLVSRMEALSSALSEKMELLEKETGELKTLLNVMKEGVMVTDEKGRIILTNPFLNEVLGGKKSWLKRSVQEAFMSAELQDAVEAVLKGIPFQKIRLTLGRENPRHFEVQVVALNPPHRQPRAVALFHETTELLYLLEVRRRFVANASWELDKPLTGIHTRLEALLPRIPQELNEVREEIGSIQKEIRRLGLLVSDMLELAGLDVEEPSTADREWVAVIPILKEAGEWADREARGKGLVFEADLERVAPETSAYWEKRRILQALLNLLDNAVKYTPSGGRITLRGELVRSAAFGPEKKAEGDDQGTPLPGPAADGLKISVADTGSGIPKEHLPRIFERFYRVDREYSRSLGGTGLGLSIVKHIIEAHGGTIEVQSEVGKGSVFTVFIPLASERISPSGNPVAPPSCRL